MNEEMNLEEMLDSLDSNDSLITKASSDIVVTKLDESEPLEGTNETAKATPREEAFKILSKYEAKAKEIDEISSKIKDVQSKIEETCPELFKEIKTLENDLAKKNEALDIIKQEATPVFRKAVELDNGDKTLTYDKIQATYVFPTEKHKFNLKLFIEEQEDFYLDNISYFDPYSEITQVSDYVKFTVKKK